MRSPCTASSHAVSGKAFRWRIWEKKTRSDNVTRNANTLAARNNEAYGQGNGRQSFCSPSLLDTGILLSVVLTLEIELDYPLRLTLKCTVSRSPHRHPFSDFFLTEGGGCKQALHDDCIGAAVAVWSLWEHAFSLQSNNEALAVYRPQVQAFCNDVPWGAGRDGCQILHFRCCANLTGLRTLIGLILCILWRAFSLFSQRFYSQVFAKTENSAEANWGPLSVTRTSGMTYGVNTAVISSMTLRGFTFLRRATSMKLL